MIGRALSRAVCLLLKSHMWFASDPRCLVCNGSRNPRGHDRLPLSTDECERLAPIGLLVGDDRKVMVTAGQWRRALASETATHTITHTPRK